MSFIYGFNGAYRFLSNFWPAEVKFEGEKYPTVEHAYQAAKTLDEEGRKKIRLAKTPKEAKALGKMLPLRRDWKEIRLQVMEDLLRQKFSAGELKELLAETRGSTLIEDNWWGDTFWGECNGIGENHLGRLLMEIRSEIPIAEVKS